MNKAKKYYMDRRNEMVHNTQYRNKDELIECEPNTFHAKLKILHIGYLNSGVLFYLEDENGKIYVMNDNQMREYTDTHDIFIEADWNFYQQGTCYSIGL